MLLSKLRGSWLLFLLLSSKGAVIPTQITFLSIYKQGMQQLPNVAETPTDTRQEEWSAKISTQALSLLTENEINRQTYVGAFLLLLPDQLSFTELSTSL